MHLVAALAVVSLAVLTSSAASPAAGLGGPAPMPGREAQPAFRGSIVAFGDSYTEGYGAEAGESYPAVLAATLGLVVVNRGISGQTAAEALPRLQADVLDLHPRLAIVEFGANEAFRQQPLSSCIEALDAMLAQLRLRGIPVLLVGVHTAGFQGDFDEALRGLAAKHGTGLVLDVLAGTLEGRFVAADGVHPNGLGYAVMAARILPEAERLLAGQGLGLVPEEGWGAQGEGTRRA